MNILPCDKCPGLCCYFPPMTNNEFKNIRKKYGIPDAATVHDLQIAKTVIKENGQCGYYQNGCSIYQDRPIVCREYGVNPKMPCMKLHPEKAELAFDRMIENINSK